MQKGRFRVEGLVVNGVTSDGDIIKASGIGTKVQLQDVSFTDNIAGNVRSLSFSIPPPLHYGAFLGAEHGTI